MMIPLQKIQAGLAAFLDNDLMPQVYKKKKGTEGMLIGVGIALIVRNLPNVLTNYIQQYKDIVDMMGITDGQGNYDIQAIAEVLKEKMGSEGLCFDLPAIGPTTFNREDVDKLVEYIER